MDEMKQAQHELNQTVVFRGISADLHSGLRKLIVDSAASGMPFEIVKDNCKKLWNQELDEEYYTEVVVNDSSITNTSNLIVSYVASADKEEVAVLGLVCGVQSVTTGSATIFGGAPNGASGTYTVNIHIV